jgi:nickel superoxide dismutase
MKGITRISMIAGLTIMAQSVLAHCEVPCGIYTDKMRVEMIREDCETIRKAMTQIEELSSQKDKNYNQIVRWVTTKEDHAKKIQEVTYQYFMTQRVKPVEMEKGSTGYDEYVHQLTQLHNILVQAMKCKQTTDPDHVDELLHRLKQFESAYFDEEDNTHHKQMHH